MTSELHSRLAKKKGGVIIILQNTTELPVVLQNAKLNHGKYDKVTPEPPSVVAPLSLAEIGVYQPEGQFAWALGSDQSHKLRLTILHGEQHAMVDKLPASCDWSADLQQDWKASVPQLLITFTHTGTPNSSPPNSPSTVSATSPKVEEMKASPTKDSTPTKSKEKKKNKSKKDDSEKKVPEEKKKGKDEPKDEKKETESKKEDKKDDHKEEDYKEDYKKEEPKPEKKEKEVEAKTEKDKKKGKDEPKVEKKEIESKKDDKKDDYKKDDYKKDDKKDYYKKEDYKKDDAKKEDYKKEEHKSEEKKKDVEAKTEKKKEKDIEPEAEKKKDKEKDVEEKKKSKSSKKYKKSSEKDKYEEEPDKPSEVLSDPFNAPSSSAFGIDKELADDSSDSDDDSSDDQAWGKRFNVVIKDRAATDSSVEDAAEDLKKRASMLVMRGAVSSPTAPKNPSSNNNDQSADDDFFKEMDLSRRASQRHLSLPPGDREKKLSQIPQGAQVEFNKAIEQLDVGNVAEASALFNAALSQLNDLAFAHNVQIAKEWCIYAQLTAILCEMKRLESEELFSQRTLLARFAGELALAGITSEKHILVCLRMAVNRNLEMENFNTAYQFLNIMKGLPYVSDAEKDRVSQKLELCKPKFKQETNAPVGATFNAATQQYHLYDKPYVLCNQSLKLIRDATYYQCDYCGAAFREKVRTTPNCQFCGSALSQTI